MPKLPHIMPSVTRCGLRFAFVGLYIISLSAAGFAQTLTAPPIRKTILFFSPYQIDMPVNTLAVQAVQEEFQQAADLSVNIYYEYLDLNRFPDAAYQEALFDLYRMKYRGKPIDVVIVSNANMLNLWLAKRADILPDAPVLFYDMNTAAAKALTLPPDVSGVTADVDFVKSARWFLRIRPDVHDMILVHGVGKADQAFRQYVDAVQAEFCGTVRCADWSSLPLPEMTRRAAALPDTAVIVYFLLLEDAAGVTYRPIDAIRQLAAAASVPVLSGYDQFIGTGTIGGYLYSIEQQARSVAQMGLRILRGEPVSAMPVQSKQGTRFIFDHRALQRWNIALSALPPDSLLKNRQHSILDHYWQLLALSAGLVILIGMVSYLGVLTRRLRAARQTLTRINAKLETQVQERTAALSDSNQRLTAENIERQQTEKKLRESHDNYQAFFNTIDDMIFIGRLTGELLYTNRAVSAKLGYTPEELTRMHILDVHPRMRRQEAETIFAAMFRGELDSCPLPLARQDGAFVPVETRIWLGKWDGQDAIYSVSKDLTRFQAAFDMFQKMFDMNPSPMAMSHGQTRKLMQVNEAFLQTLGFKREEVIGQTAFDLRIFDDPAEQVKPAEELLIQGYFKGHDVTLRTKTGDRLHGVFSGTKIDYQGEPLFLTVMMDLTERKRAENALRESEERYRRVSSVISDIAYSCVQNETGVYEIDWMTGATERMLGYAVDEIIARRCWGALVIEEDVALFDQQIIRLAPGSRSACELRLRHKNGSIRWVSSCAECTVSENRHQLYGGLVDITERKQVEDALRRSEAFLDSIIEHSPNSLWISDEHGTLLRMNQACRDTLHVRDEEVVGKYNIFQDNLMIEQGFLPLVTDVFEKGASVRFVTAYDTAEIKGLEFQQTTSMVLDVHISPILDAQGRVTNAVIQHVDITERRRTEEALRESEARWQFALEGSGDGVWDWNSQTNIVFFSNQWKTMFGFEPSEIGDSLAEWDSRVHPDDRDRVYAAIQQHFDGLTPVYMSDHRVRCKNGAYKWILDRGKVISRTPDGKPLRVIGTHSDISARKQAEHVLQESEAKYRRLVENIPDILYVFSSTRGNIFCSPCVEKILGYSPEHLYQHPMLWNQSIHPDDMPKVAAAVTQFQQGQNFKVEYRIKDAAGEWRWLYDRSIGRQDLPGELLIEGLALDITDRKRAEEDLRLFKTIVETSEEAVAISDAASQLVYINPAHARLFGRSLEEARQANYRDYYPPESVELLNREVMPSLSCGKSWQGVLDVFDANGRRFPLWEHADSILDADGNMLYSFGFMHDDTLRKNVEEALKQAKAAAETANRTKSAFLANMSHELRTPLNAILGYAQILKRYRALSEEVRKGLNIIEDSGNYLLELINDILDLAKVEAGKLEIHPAPMSLFTLLDDVQAIMAIKAEHNGLRFEVIKETSLPEHVEGDAHRLRQILLNLLGNAIKFTDHGGVTLRVTGENVETHGCASSGDETRDRETHNRASLRFSIEDTGVGIAPDDVSMLFAPFQQVGDTARKAQGTGLGLAISRNLATLMGGTLTVTSTVGVGSVFRFEVSLPVLAAPAALAAQRVIIGVNGVAPTILVVDDVAANRQVLAELLTPHGCRILQAANGEEAIRQAFAEHPAAIITDLKMPDSDGFELIQRLRLTPECQNTIIIVSSASVYSDDRERSLTAGGQAFLPKPVQAETLYELLERFGVATWRYQEETLAPAASEAAEILPPFAMLKTLFEFADIGDIVGFREHLTLLATSDVRFTPFVTRLQELAQHFQFEQIRRILLRSLEESTGRPDDLLLGSNGATTIPPDWLDRLRRAIAITDIQDITNLLRDMRAIDPILTDTLEKLAYNFEYDKMLRLL